MSQQEVSSVSAEQWSRPAQPASDKTWDSIRSGIYLIAWFIMFDTFYSITRSVIGFMDTDYILDDSGRLFVGASVAAILSFLILSAVKSSQN